MKVWLDRTPFGCKPSDAESEAVLKRIPIGTTFEADVITRKSRSTQWNRRYWLLMSMLASNLDHVEVEPGVVLRITDSESAHVAMKYATGLYDQYVLEAGMVRIIKSIAFERMDADEWAAYWPRVLDAVHEKFLPGVEIPAMEDEIARLAS
jgi:hypothetical protein